MKALMLKPKSDQCKPKEYCLQRGGTIAKGIIILGWWSRRYRNKDGDCPKKSAILLSVKNSEFKIRIANLYTMSLSFSSAFN